MDWRQFVMDLESLDPATVEELFDRLGASSVTLSDAGDDPVLEPGPGETPLWSSTRITVVRLISTSLFRASTASRIAS